MLNGSVRHLLALVLSQKNGTFTEELVRIGLLIVWIECSHLSGHVFYDVVIEYYVFWNFMNSHSDTMSHFPYAFPHTITLLVDLWY